MRFHSIVAVAFVLSAALVQGACTGDCPPDSSGSLFCGGSGASLDASVEPPPGEPPPGEPPPGDPTVPEPNPCDDLPAGGVCEGDTRCSDVGKCTCGDGILDPGEECDNDSAGCDDTCHFVCSDAVPCPGPTECRESSVCNLASNACEPGEPLPEGTPCPGGQKKYQEIRRI